MPIQRSDALIAVVGSAHPRAREGDLAKTVGTALAQNDFIVVCGGRNVGIMGRVVDGIGDQGRSVGLWPDCNPDGKAPTSISIKTNAGNEQHPLSKAHPEISRNRLLISLASVVIVVGEGGQGTANEFKWAMTYEKPTFALGINKLATPEGGGRNFWRADDQDRNVKRRHKMVVGYLTHRKKRLTSVAVGKLLEFLNHWIPT